MITQGKRYQFATGTTKVVTTWQAMKVNADGSVFFARVLSSGNLAAPGAGNMMTVSAAQISQGQALGDLTEVTTWSN